MLLALHSLHFRFHPRVVLTLAIALAAVAVLCAEPPYIALMGEAVAAEKAGDSPLAVARLEAARALRPDYPRVLYHLACACAGAGRDAEALAALQTLADMGLTYPIGADARLAALRSRQEFDALERAFAVNAAPHGSVRVAFRLDRCDGIVEGLAFDAAGNGYFGDVRHRCLWRRDSAGRFTRFSHEEDPLLGVFGLKVDAFRGALWAGTAAVPEMQGLAASERGRSALVEFDLASGRVRRTFPVPADGRTHVLGDLLVIADGRILATDSTAPIIWSLPPHGSHLQRWLESDDFVSLQGLALAPDGRNLIVADYASGLWRVSLADQSHELLPPPAGATLFGIDGLYTVAGGLVGVQNGVSPQRVVRIALTPSGRIASVRCLVSGYPAMDDLSLGAVVNGGFRFIGNSGWALFEGSAAPPAPHTVSIFETQI